MKVKYFCIVCNTEKEVYNNKNQSFKFCSRKCYFEWRNKSGTTKTICKICGKERKFKASEIRRGQRVYCGFECYNRDRCGISTTHKRGRSWKKQREKSLKRDNYICRLCSRTPAEVVHHIIPYKDFESHKEANKLNNLISLCHDCHVQTYLKEYEFIGVFKDILQGEDLSE